MFWSETAVEISILARLFWLRVQIIYMPFLIRTDKEIISNSKFTRLTTEKTLSFIWHLFHLGKWRQWGKKNHNKTTHSLTKILQLKFSSLVRRMIISPRDCVSKFVVQFREIVRQTREVTCVPCFGRSLGSSQPSPSTAVLVFTPISTTLKLPTSFSDLQWPLMLEAPEVS